jgi:hypothetical protein
LPKEQSAADKTTGAVVNPGRMEGQDLKG